MIDSEREIESLFPILLSIKVKVLIMDTKPLQWPSFWLLLWLHLLLHVPLFNVLFYTAPFQHAWQSSYPGAFALDILSDWQVLLDIARLAPSLLSYISLLKQSSIIGGPFLINLHKISAHITRDTALHYSRAWHSHHRECDQCPLELGSVQLNKLYTVALSTAISPPALFSFIVLNTTWKHFLVTCLLSLSSCYNDSFTRAAILSLFTTVPLEIRTAPVV